MERVGSQINIGRMLLKNTTKAQRSPARETRNQLKIYWDRIKKPVGEFHGCWVRTNSVYKSGYSDDQLMEMAEKMYASEHKDKEFMLKHMYHLSLTLVILLSTMYATYYLYSWIVIVMYGSGLQK